MDNNFNDNIVIAFLPIKNQAAKSATALLAFLVFGTVQWIRSDQPGQLGLLDFWLFSLPVVPNDYKLIVIVSALSLVLLLIFTLTTIIDTNKFNSLVLSFLNIIPTVGNFIILLFFFYIILYRGIWSLIQLKSGFSIIPLLKFLFFAGYGIFGYKAFCHFYQLKKLLRQKIFTEFFDYVDKYKLNKK